MKYRTPLLLKCFNLYTLLLVFNIINLAVYGMLCSSTIVAMTNQVENVMVVNGVCCVLGVLLIMNEIYLSSLVIEHFRFLCTFRGRGLSYILLSILIYQPIVDITVIATYTISAVGIMYIILSFIPQLMPSNDIKGNVKSYQQYLEELNASYCGSDMSQTRIKAFQHPDTIRNINVSVIQMANPSFDHGEKHDAELAMEINEALNKVQYEDFVSDSNQNVAYPNPTLKF